MDWENCQVTPDNENVLKGMQWVQDYVNKYGPDKMYAFIQNAIKPWRPADRLPFVQGRLGSMITGNWSSRISLPTMPDADIGYTFIPVPAEGDASVTWAGVGPVWCRRVPRTLRVATTSVSTCVVPMVPACTSS
jgi:ABC-type glycerol-3-phosphate transport system substrate-binding protein